MVVTKLLWNTPLLKKYVRKRFAVKSTDTYISQLRAGYLHPGQMMQGDASSMTRETVRCPAVKGVRVIVPH